MKTFSRILFIVAFTFLSVNLFRLVYQNHLEPHASVLDEYDEVVEAEIKSASSLDELADHYRLARERVAEYEAETANPVVEYRDRDRTEPYKSEIKYRAAIQEWEKRSRQIFELRAYWLFGFLFLVAGIASYRWFSPWLGISSLVVAFSEMIYWTSPAYFSGRSLEFERLLSNKLMFGLTTYGLLIAAGYLLEALKPDQKNASA